MSPRKASSSNPAQRLHEILTRHDEVFATNQRVGYNKLWADIFRVEEDAVTEHVAQAFGLIGEVGRALATTGDESQRVIFELHKDNWSLAFIPQSSGRGQHVNGGRTSVASRAALGGIASHLRDNLPPSKTPTEEEQEGLRAMVRELIEVLREDESLPPHLHAEFLQRLYEMLWALDHISIMGPEGIATAADRLVLSCARAEASVREQEERAEGETDQTKAERSILERAKEVVTTANEAVSAPGAWYGTTVAAYELAQWMGRVFGFIGS